MADANSVATDFLDIGGSIDGPSEDPCDSILLYAESEDAVKHTKALTIDVGVQACPAEELLALQDISGGTGGTGSATVASPKARTGARSVRSGNRDISPRRITRSQTPTKPAGWRKPWGSPASHAATPSTPRQQSRSHQASGERGNRGSKSSARPSSETRRPYRGDDPIAWRTSMRAEKRRETWRHAASAEDNHPSPENREEESPRETMHFDFAAGGDLVSAAYDGRSLAESQRRLEDRSPNGVAAEEAALQERIRFSACMDVARSFTPGGSGAASVCPYSSLAASPHHPVVFDPLAQMQQQPARAKSPMAMPRSPTQTVGAASTPRVPLAGSLSMTVARDSTPCKALSPGYPVISPRAVSPRAMSPSLPSAPPAWASDRDVQRFASAGPAVTPVSWRKCSTEQSRQVNAMIEPARLSSAVSVKTAPILRQSTIGSVDPHARAAVATIQTAAAPTTVQTAAAQAVQTVVAQTAVALPAPNVRPVVTRMISSSVAASRCHNSRFNQNPGTNSVNSSVVVNPTALAGAVTSQIPIQAAIPRSSHTVQAALPVQTTVATPRAPPLNASPQFPRGHNGAMDAAKQPVPSQALVGLGSTLPFIQARSLELGQMRVQETDELSTRTALPIEDDQDLRYDLQTAPHLVHKSFEESLCDSKKAEDARRSPSYVPRIVAENESSVRRILQDEHGFAQHPRTPGPGSGFVYREDAQVVAGIDDLRKAEAELRYTANAEVQNNFIASLRDSTPVSTPSKRN